MKLLKNIIVLLTLLFLSLSRIDVFAKLTWGYDIYVVREDDQSEGFKDSKEYFNISFGCWGGLEKPYTGPVKKGVDGFKDSNKESWFYPTTWFFDWDKDYVNWFDYGVNHKKLGNRRIQFSLMTYTWNSGKEDREYEVLFLEFYKFILLKCWDGNASNTNYLMELPEGYMFYMTDHIIFSFLQ